MTRPLKRLLPLAFLASLATTALAQAPEALITLSTLPLASSQQLHEVQMHVVTDMKVRPRQGASEEELEQLHRRLGTAKMPLSMDMQTQLRLQTGPVDARQRMPLTARVEASRLDARDADGKPMPGTPAQGLPDMQFSAQVVNDRFEDIRQSDANLLQLPPEQVESTFRRTFGIGTLSRLNGAPLRVGESLELPLDMNLPPAVSNTLGKAGQVMARYTLAKVQAGVAYFDIRTELDAQVPLPAPPGGSTRGDAPPLVIKGSGTGQLQLGLADHLPLRNDLDLTLQLQLPMPGGHSMQMDTQVRTRSEGRAIPAGTGSQTSPSPR